MGHVLQVPYKPLDKEGYELVPSFSNLHAENYAYQLYSFEEYFEECNNSLIITDLQFPKLLGIT